MRYTGIDDFIRSSVPAFLGVIMLFFVTARFLFRLFPILYLLSFVSGDTPAALAFGNLPASVDNKALRFLK